jgi:hypothetical protein
LHAGLLLLAERVGFEPTVAFKTTPLFESGTFNHSDTSPEGAKSDDGAMKAPCGADGRTRTDDLLITNQLLYRLSYTSERKVVTPWGFEPQFAP